MEDKKTKSKYWMRKFQEANWSDFRELEVGSIFETSVSNHVQMADRIGDIIFWYRTDKDKGIYFITQVVSIPYPGDNNTGYWMDLKVIKTIVNNPVIPEKQGFKQLIEKINKMGQGGSTYNLTFDDKPEELMNLILGNEKLEFKELGIKEIEPQNLTEIVQIKDEYLKSDAIFNPFIDTDLAKSEVRHLNFITNLINPHGSHLQGDKFLKIFIDELLEYEDLQDNKDLQNFCDVPNIQVQVEKAIPNGRIDIYMENDEFIIAIEGKTETEDSKGQLKKYNDFLKKQNKPYLLFYLTKYGSKPKFEIPENLQLMSFYNEIIPFIKKVLNLNNLPEKINYIIDEYYNALITYIYNFTSTWTYDLNIIDEIIKDRSSYLEYEKIKQVYFYNTEKYQHTIVEDIANVFEKAKAAIERNFMMELSNYLADELKKYGFLFLNSNISVNASIDNNIDINDAINTIYEARKNRTKVYSQKTIDENPTMIREETLSMVCYKNIKNDNETILLILQNDILGLTVDFYQYKNDELINGNIDTLVYLTSDHKFNSKNISKLLDKKTLDSELNLCKRKILTSLKEIN